MNTVSGSGLFKMITGVSTPAPPGRAPSGAVVSRPQSQGAGVSAQASGAPAAQQAAPGPTPQATTTGTDAAVSFRSDAPRGTYVDIRV